MSMLAMVGSRKIISEIQDELDFVLDHPVVRIVILYAIIDTVVKNVNLSIKLTFVLTSFWLFYKSIFKDDVVVLQEEEKQIQDEEIIKSEQ